MSEKITALLEEIKGLTVLELSELVHALEEEFGVSAAAMAAPAAAAAPAAEEKTEFDVILASFDAAAKIKVIKVVREITGQGLAEAKAVVEGAPKALKEGVSKEDYTAAARILCKFAEGHDNFKVKSGFLDGEVADVATIESLAKLPSKEVLLATVCSAFQAPIAAFARAVQAIVDKDGSADAE